MADFPAGGPVTADDLNNRINDWLGGQFRTTDLTATSGTTEKLFATSASENLLASTTYRVVARGSIVSSVANDEFALRVRETNVSGTIRDGVVCRMFGSPGGPYPYYAEYVFTTTVAVTGIVFCGTVVRLTGTGTATMQENSYVLIERLADSGVISSV